MTLKFTAMILAAGYGRRMLPLTKQIPKPLLDINGITLLDNSINFVKKLGCNQIIINTHYKYKKIHRLVDSREDKDMISLLYEKDILDTGGAVKNAAKFFANSNILIVNSDIFWKSYNLNDVQKLINSYVNNNKAHLLLVPKNNAKGLNKISGDFVLNKNLISRYKKGDDIFFYSGLQIIPANILLNFEYKKFSLNEIWDYLIKNQNLFGTTMSSNWFHVGDIQGLEIARKLDS